MNCSYQVSFHLNKVLLFCVYMIFVLGCLSHSDQALNKSFLKAVEKRDFYLMEELLKKGADINCTYKKGKLTALTSAAAMGDVELVKFLIKNGSTIEGNAAFPNSPIYLAIGENHLKIVDMLLDAGVDPDYAWAGWNGGTLLTNAVQFGKLEVVKLLLERGADVNFTGNGNFTPLYRSIIYDISNVMEFLLKKGAKLNKNDISSLEEVGWFKKTKNKKAILLLKANKAL